MIDLVYVHTDLGTIKGVANEHYEAFKGIPYATSPIGEYRFKRAQPYAQSLEGFKAVKFSAIPIQPPNSLESFFNVQTTHYTQDEDCLTLNIWRPKQTTASDRLPVIVYFYGGSFVNGHSALDLYDPASIVSQQRVIVVTLNYRLGALGFLDWSTLHPDWENNLGLSDQHCALQWVTHHITDFGGDPQCITAMGQSAGAMSVQALLLHPTSRKMIHRAILLSGALQWMTPQEASVKAQEFKSIKETLYPNIPWLALSASQILTLMEKLQAQYGKSKGLEFLYAPIKTDAFEDDFSNLRLPVLISQTQSEGDIYIKSENRTLNHQQFQKVSRRTHVDVPHANDIQTAQQQRDWITKHYFHRPIHTLTQALSRYTHTWSTTFAWCRPEHSYYASSYHILDVPFWFGRLEILTAHGLTLTDKEWQLSHEMIQDMCTFAKTGKCNWTGTKHYH